MLVDIVAEQQQLCRGDARFIDVEVELDGVFGIVVVEAVAPVAVRSSGPAVVVVVIGQNIGAAVAAAASAVGGEADLVDIGALVSVAFVGLVDKRDPDLGLAQ